MRKELFLGEEGAHLGGEEDQSGGNEPFLTLFLSVWRLLQVRLYPGCRSPLPLHVAKTVRNHLNEEITPLLPTGIDERYCQAISNLGHA